MQQLYLGIFVASMAALVVTGCILTRKPRKKLPTETLRPAVPDEHQRCDLLKNYRVPGLTYPMSCVGGTPNRNQIAGT